MWVNPGEIPGNGIDDDENGFVDGKCWYALFCLESFVPQQAVPA
jgi:hypothetical protein